MWKCFPFCPLSYRAKEKDDAQAVSPRPLTSVPEECGGSFVLTQFSPDVERRRVEFVPPVPTLARCSLCGLVPPRLYTSESCRHAFCSHCLDNAQRHCPFDGSAWRPAATDTETLELVSKASVFCWNRSTGCSYVGCLLDMPSHYHKCQYYMTRCGMCDQEVRMKDLTAHARRLCSAAGGPDAEKRCVVRTSPGAAVFPRDPSRSHSFSSLTRLRRADFIWTIGPYSKIRHGVHFFRSEPFLTKSGHMVQLLGSIDSVNTVELRTAVSYLPGHKGQAQEWRNPGGTGSFFLLKNNQLGHISETTLSAKTVHVNLENVPANAWQSVARLDKARFEKDFVSNGAFVLEFSE